MKVIQGYTNYNIHEDGTIINNRTGRVMKFNANHKGYLHVQLSDKGKKRTITLHRLIYLNFIGEIPQGLEVNHIDGNKENNHISNLELVTRKENMRKAVLNGQIKSGAECPLAVPVIQRDPITKKVINTYGSINIATKETMVAGSSISNVINGHRLSAGGFLWEKGL